METIHIAACFDHGYVMPTGVMMYSVCANNPDVNIVFHLIIDESVQDDDRKDLSAVASGFCGKTIAFYSIKSLLSTSFPLIREEWLTRSTYYRLYLSEILPASLDKVLYLDGDCIVRHSLRQLWETNLSGYAVGGVFDSSESDIEYYNRLKYPPVLGYFNAGVLLVNLDYWRCHDVSGMFFEFIKSCPDRIIYEDQDVMNYVFREKKQFVDVKYNLQTAFLRISGRWDYWKYEDELKAAIVDPTIVHFTEENKPWLAYSHCRHPYIDIFYKYQDQTKWKGMRYEKRSFKQKMKNYVGDYLRHIGYLKPIKSPYITVSPID